uniref:Uncharacterized protein n=1 Tax=Mycena chlorophos TaxID=658473 RepID=A0ABQ0L384_MYCCL|nr:predicted protein [Mycena chlorophos]
MSDSAEDSETSHNPRPLVTLTGKRHANPNWGGRRANSGRPPKKAKTAAPTHSSRPTPPKRSSPRARRVSNTSLPLIWKNAPVPAFFNPRCAVAMPANTAATTDTHDEAAMPSLTLAEPELGPTSDDPAHLTNADYANLTRNLTFIQENDEFADIMAGDTINGESMFEDLAPADGDDSANIAAQETEASAPQPDSASHTHLKKALKRIKREIKKYGEPLCYIRGDLYDRPRHALFAVRDAAKTGFAPAPFCLMDIFVWLPALLPGAPESFKCDCARRLPLTKHGWNSDPIARRVKSFPRDFFLLTNRFICNPDRVDMPGCGKTFQGTDPHLIAQLPRFTQAAFPGMLPISREAQAHGCLAFLSACGALDKLIVSMMGCTFATRFGPAPCSELFSELQHKHHSETELIYLDGARHFAAASVPQFSAFGDRQGWHGSPPSVHYLRAMFVDSIEAKRVLIERAQACLPGTVLKADHTFDLLKYMGGLRGEKIHTAAYTMNNEFEEIRSHSLVPSKALEFVEDAFIELNEGLKEHGHPVTQLLYSDSPQSLCCFESVCTQTDMYFSGIFVPRKGASVTERRRLPHHCLDGFACL